MKSLSRWLKNPSRWHEYEATAAPYQPPSDPIHGGSQGNWSPPAPHANISVTVGGPDDPAAMVYGTHAAKPKR